MALSFVMLSIVLGLTQAPIKPFEEEYNPCAPRNTYRSNLHHRERLPTVRDGVLQTQDHRFRRRNHQCCSSHTEAVLPAQLSRYVHSCDQISRGKSEGTQFAMFSSYSRDPFPFRSTLTALLTIPLRWRFYSDDSLLPLGICVRAVGCIEQPFPNDAEHHSVQIVRSPGRVLWRVFLVSAHHLGMDPATLWIPVCSTSHQLGGSSEDLH